ncbi:hypothetical protein GM3708_372 [Geminocystis sp. NIES-3708]|uniref:DUF1822 family protein n=1 Tax=Geminocystis sp. NIES-3708 TaxID=1615909 RepID=UPI0005FCC28E|nr:DUF1822 family protein [Geminocystis sp. NIES-3708]BAQ59966.1 hypothetical protein GM3708_372 [Geminocystis sp. NIES-3708]
MSLDLFTAFHSEHLWLKFTPEDLAKATAMSKECSPNGSQYQGLLNAISSICLLQWLNITYPNINNFQWEFDHFNLLSIWEFVNGTSFMINNNSSRLILLPQESQDLTEFNIPQEWVDIPRFCGDYFLPVHVDLDNNWLRFWGFSSHEKIKKYASYNDNFAEYSLSEYFVERDLSLLFIFEKYALSSQPKCEPLPILSSQEKSNLLLQLNQTNSLTIRIRLNFVQWAAIFSDDIYRQFLYQQCQPISLGAWLNHNFKEAYAQGWQHLRDLVDNFDLITDSPSFPPNGIVMRSGEINLQYIYQIQDEQQLKIAAQRLSVLPPDSIHKHQAIQALDYIMTKSHDDDTRWNAAEGIWRLEPNNPNAGLWCGKRLNFGVDVGGFSFALVIGLLPKSENENSIFFRLYGINDSHTLPHNLKVNIMDENTYIFKQLEARNDDRLLQYKFWGKKGEYFWIQISCGSSQLSEGFII